MTSQALNRPVDVQSFFADLLCYLSSRDDLAGYEIEQTEQVRDAVAELIEACRAYVGPMDDPRIGWCGQSPSHPGMFKCESCGQEHWDCSLIEHKPGCSAPRLLAALAVIGSQP